MAEPTQEMRREAGTGRFYDSAWGHNPRLQIFTIGELLDGKGVNMPPISQLNDLQAGGAGRERARGAEGARF